MRRSRLRRRYGRSARSLTAFEQGLLRQARETMKKSAWRAGIGGVVGGGMTRSEARAVIRDLTGEEA